VVSPQRWAELAREWFPELADTRLRQVTWPAIALSWDYIVAKLEAGVTMATIHQRLRDERCPAVGLGGVPTVPCAGPGAHKDQPAGRRPADGRPLPRLRTAQPRGKAGSARPSDR
jgi:hypothetical protein